MNQIARQIVGADLFNRSTFRGEKMATCWDEAKKLSVEHYAAIAHYQDIPLNPDDDAYRMLEANGRLRIYTIRDEDNRMMGYQIFILGKNIHYKDSLQAVQDVLWITPSWRGFGHKFIDWCDSNLHGEGVQVVMQHMKAKHAFGETLCKMGYELQDLIYTRRLDK